MRAYAVTFRVLLSYGLLLLGKNLFGAQWYRARVMERHQINARRVKSTILKLQGLFIKVGQLISIMTNFLPEAFRKELEGLQDRIPARPIEEIITRIQAEFDKSPEVLFAAFGRTPLASASLAQVHAARLHDGRRVAVKVQHANIEETAAQDLKAIRRILGIVALFVRIKGLETYHAQVSEMIYAELDFKQEARNLETIAANFTDEDPVGFPTVIHDYTTGHILTTSFVEGVKITDVEGLAHYNIDRAALAERVVSTYCQMIFRDGLYHADPHPGNLFVEPDGRLVFIDFGAVARLSEPMQAGLPKMLEGVLQNDTDQIVAALRQMGFLAHDDDAETAEKLMAFVKQRFLDEIRRESFALQDLQVDLESQLKLLVDFRKLDISIRELTASFQVPKDWVLLERTLALLLGVCTFLSPSYNPFSTLQPYFEQMILGEDRSWESLISRLIKDTAVSLGTLPMTINRFLDQTSDGNLEVRIRNLDQSVRLLYALGHQVLYGMFTLGSGVLAYMAHIQGEPTLSNAFTAGSGFFLLCLAGSLFRARRHK